jgi:hypothetical protein
VISTTDHKTTAFYFYTSCHDLHTHTHTRWGSCLWVPLINFNFDIGKWVHTLLTHLLSLQQYCYGTETNLRNISVMASPQKDECRFRRRLPWRDEISFLIAYLWFYFVLVWVLWSHISHINTFKDVDRYSDIPINVWDTHRLKFLM